MGDVLDRWRLNQGFNPYDEPTQLAAIASWVHVLDRDGVPANAYCELYERALRTRAMAIQNGRDIPRMGVELMIAGWLGENGLMRERQKGTNKYRDLLNEPRYEPKCDRCMDTGKIMKGAFFGEKCDHAG